MGAGPLPAARDLYETGDLVQETMIAVLSGSPISSPSTTGALRLFPDRDPEPIRELAATRPAQGQDRSRSELVGGAFPLEEVVGREAVDRYEAALRRLRPDDREAIHLRVELDLPYPEVAREIDKPTVAAARMAVSRALYRLAREMQRDA